MNSGSSIGFQEGGTGPLAGPQQSGPDGAAPPSTQTGYSKKDTISSIAAAEAAMMFFANFPSLSPPGDVNQDASGIMGISGISSLSPEEFKMAIALRMDEIITQVLNSWNKNLKEIEEQIKQELNSPRYLAWQQEHSAQYVASVETQSAIKGFSSYQSFLNTLAPADRIEEMNSNQEFMLRIGLIQGLENYKNSVDSGSANAAEALPFVAATMIIAPSLISHFAATTAPIGESVNLQVQFMKDTFQQFAPLFPPDVAGASSLIAALFGTSLVYSAAASSIGSSAKGEKSSPEEMAIKFSKEVVQFLQNEVLSNFLIGSMVNKMEGTNKMSDARKQELVVTIKVILLATAIGAIYKANTQWITGQEFLDLIDGKMHLTKTDPKTGEIEYLLSKDSVLELQKLIPLIQGELMNLKNASPGEYQKLRAALAQYMDSRPSYDRLFDINDSVSSVFQTAPYQPINEK